MRIDAQPIERATGDLDLDRQVGRRVDVEIDVVGIRTSPDRPGRSISSGSRPLSTSSRLKVVEPVGIDWDRKLPASMSTNLTERATSFARAWAVATSARRLLDHR